MQRYRNRGNSIFRHLYEGLTYLLVGDRRRHRAYLKRAEKVEQLKRELDPVGVTEFDRLVARVEEELDVRAIPSETSSVLGSPQSAYYKLESADEFLRRRESTVRRFERLRLLDPERFRT